MDRLLMVDPAHLAHLRAVSDRACAWVRAQPDYDPNKYIPRGWAPEEYLQHVLRAEANWRKYLEADRKAR